MAATKTTKCHKIHGLRWTVAEHDRGWDAIATLNVRGFQHYSASRCGETEWDALDALRDYLCLEYQFRIDSSICNELGDVLEFTR